jgi:beta-lactamase regulating signal transducer with metallopeptidase domain
MIDSGWFIDVALKSALVAALALLAARALRRRSAAERSSVLHGGLVAMALLPLLMAVAPRWQVEVPAAMAPDFVATSDAPVAARVADTGSDAANPVSAASDSAPHVARVSREQRTTRLTLEPAALAFEATGIDLRNVFGVLYALPALALLFGLAMSLSQLRALRDRAAPVRDARWNAALQAAKQRSGVRGQVELLHSSDIASPLSWGVRRRIIVLDAGAIDPASAEALLAHELAHLTRHDWVKLLFSRFVLALFWFNPLAWWLARRCHQLREEAADDAVLRSQVAGEDYAELLLRFARNAAPQRLFAAHAICSGRGAMQHLAQRLTRVLDDGERRAPAMRAWSAGCVAVALAIALPVAAFAPGAAATQAATSVAATATAASPARVQASVVAASSAAATAATAEDELTFLLQPRRTAEPGRIQLTIQQHSDRDRNSNSDGIELSKLQGLTPAQLASTQPQALQFRIVRAAGTLDCDGVGQRNRGTGTCRFVPDAAFAAELERRGVGRPDARQHLQLALQDAQLGVLDELARQGYETPNIKRFVEFSIHHVDTAWLRGLDSVGLRVDSLSRLLEFRIHDVDAAYVGELQAVGYDKLAPDQLLEFRIHNVSAESILGLTEAGFTDLSARQLVTLHIHNVTPDFAREMKALGYGDVGADRLLEFRIHDVTPAFVREMAELGYRNLPASRLVEFRVHDVTPAFIRAIAELGYRNVDADDLVSMRIHDVTPSYIRGELAGNQRPSVDELVSRKIHGD